MLLGGSNLSLRLTKFLGGLKNAGISDTGVGLDQESNPGDLSTALISLTPLNYESCVLSCR